MNPDARRYKYPLEENVRENAAEDARCLQLVEEAIEDQAKLQNPIAGYLSTEKYMIGHQQLSTFIIDN